MAHKIAVMAGRQFRLGLIQLAVNEEKTDNIIRAVQMIRSCTLKGAQIVALPECFNCPYGTKYFADYSEEIPDGETCQIMSALANECKIYIVAGSIPEREGDKIYNTSTVWSPEGNLICKHRKLHLFDIDIPGGITFKESEVLSPGKELSMFETKFCKFGLAICYDLRFEELARLYRKNECQCILYPGAFNTVTGPKHWELLLRARAVDNEVFVAGIAPALDETADYQSFGHTSLIDPWGKVLNQLKFEESMIIEDVDTEAVFERRNEIPTFKHRRTDVYETVEKK